VLRWGKSTASLNLKWGEDGIPAFFGTKEEECVPFPSPHSFLFV
jgi:hypothetical protein